MKKVSIDINRVNLQSHSKSVCYNRNLDKFVTLGRHQGHEKTTKENSFYGLFK